MIGCGKEHADVPPPTNDSLLSKPLNPKLDTIPLPDSIMNVWWVDKSRMRTPEHLALLKRFNALDVRDIYHYFKPIRNENAKPSSPQVQEFLQKYKITLDELKAILEEGDRLEWSGVK
jgi:hypothetical protein